MDTSPLFRPFTVKGLTVPNRIVMAPMTRSKSPGGVPGEDVSAYYARRAAADVGLIVSEGTLVRRKGASSDENIPLFWGDEALAGWRHVIDAVHERGGRMAPQIWHMGMARKPGTGHFPDAPSDSPSGRAGSGKQVFDPPSEEEVEDMVEAYAEGAADAVRIGFDAVEFHGAHGYLIDQFFWDVTNAREDKYGGDTAGRTGFAAEIVRRTRARIPDEVPIILRWSQWKQFDYAARLVSSPDELEAFLTPLSEAGVDVFHCSQRRYWEPEFPEIDGEDGLNLAGWVKKVTGAPTISVGSVGLQAEFFGAFTGQGAKARPLEDLMERMDRDEFDMIAVGRALLQDPEWATKVKEGRLGELADYDGEAIKTLY